VRAGHHATDHGVDPPDHAGLDSADHADHPADLDPADHDAADHDPADVDAAQLDATDHSPDEPDRGWRRIDRARARS
jgi:hypothetical protein